MLILAAVLVAFGLGAAVGFVATLAHLTRPADPTSYFDALARVHERARTQPDPTRPAR